MLVPVTQTHREHNYQICVCICYFVLLRTTQHLKGLIKLAPQDSTYPVLQIIFAVVWSHLEGVV